MKLGSRVSLWGGKGMKTKIFKVIYERKEMLLIATKLSVTTMRESKLFYDCNILEELILFDFLDQSKHKEEGGLMFMVAKEFIERNFENLKSGQDIKLTKRDEIINIIGTCGFTAEIFHWGNDNKNE